MGLTSLAKALLANDQAVVDESRRTAGLARRLLTARPDWSVGPAGQGRLEALTNELEAAAAAIDGRLIMGLLGGTGVGKSTLISALAGEEISEASVIRPTTSQPVIYRHQAFPPLAGWDGLEVIHQAERLKALAVVDFPDFDSLETKHHQTVNEHLSELDLVVWLTDYHKYADRRLYEVMARAGAVMAAPAQVFLLNKADELLARPDGEEALRYVLDSLSDQLTRFGGWAGPRPWPVSAREALADPQNPQAGGLAPLHERLDQLAEAKYRRALEAGNLETRRRNLIRRFEEAARPDQWLGQLEALKGLQERFNPDTAIEADLALLTLARPSYLAPHLDELKKRTRGLLGLFTDGWDFVAGRFKAGPDLPPPIPWPQTAALARTLGGAGEDLALITGQPPEIKPDDLNRQGGAIVQKALSDNFKARKVGSGLLFLWPIALAFLLVWAETGGQYGGPAALTAAVLRSAAPWLIFSFLGDLILSRFIWFRVRRAYEADFHRALDEARSSLGELARRQAGQPLAEAMDRRTNLLNLLADLARENKEAAS
ncbi:50S ribosome-binding GTPase [Deltaproteobacteria bacterium OttesenSCG-928-M10]|nr:50S ribosome-binding GTPase [Deltaproteobacteria bacterium OttesenSCG-928-M10]